MAEKSQTKAAAAMADDKKRAIETAMQQIERTYGKGSIMRFGDNTVSNVEAISTGSLALDLALGIGGLPKGRIIEIYGPESSGKTTLALHVLAQAQKAGGEVAFIDAEHALDITYARALGVKVEDMLVSQPDTGEQALEITEALVRSGAIDVIVVDSVAALVPRAEIEGEMGDSFVGLHARLMSQALRKLTGAVGKTNTIVIFINQLREKVGVMYGNPEVTTGGRALKFYSSVRIDVRRIEHILDLDAEHALDITYARALGVKVEDMLVSQPDTGEQALEITEALVRSGAIDVIVVDSVAALVPRAEIEGEMGDSFVGLHARLMSQALRKLTGAVGKTNTIVIFINQLREKVGVMYGNPEVTTGGRALKFYSSVRIDVRRIEALKNGSEIIGNRTRAKVVKNKMAPPFREAEFDIMYGEGISLIGELIDLGVKLGLVQKSGSWYSMGETRIGQGRDAAKQYLKNNPEIADNLEAEIRRNFDKLMTGQSRVAAKAAGRAVDVSADDFKDED